MLGACTFQAEVADGVIVTCDPEARVSECPPALVCSAVLGRCVRPTGDSSLAVVASRVTPSLVRAGDTVQVLVEPSRPLEGPPRLRLVPAAAAPLALEAAATLQDDGTWVLVFQTQPTDPEGTHTIVTDLISSTGVVTTGVSVGTVRYDFTAPTVSPGSALVLFPGPDSPLLDVEGLSATGRARLSLVFSEALAGEPSVWCGDEAAPTLSFTRVGTDTAPWRFEGTLGASPVTDGPCRILVRASDEAGNTSTSEVPLEGEGLVVDTTPPRPPAVETEGLVVMLRAPQGRSAASPEPRFEVSGGDGGVEGASVVVVLAQPIGDGGLTTLARAPVAATGAFGPVDLGSLDRETVFVQAVDAAGNVSAPVEVRDVSVVLRTGPNSPHRFLTSAVASEALIRPDLVDRAEAFTGVAGAASTIVGGASWIRGQERSHPTFVVVGCAADPLRSQAMGSADSPLLRGLARSSWQSRLLIDTENDGNPPARNYSAITADRRRGEVLMFGGRIPNLGSALDDLWSFNGRSWRLRSVVQAPPPRFSHAMAYDPRRGVTVVTGGASDVATLQRRVDTWEWNGSQWRQTSATGSPAEHLGSMAWDDVGQRMLLYVAADRTGCAGCRTDAGLYEYDDDGGWQFVGEAPLLAGDSNTTPILAARPSGVQVAGVAGNELQVHALTAGDRWVQRVAFDAGTGGFFHRAHCYDPGRQKMVTIIQNSASVRTFLDPGDGGLELVSTWDSNAARSMTSRVLAAPGWDPASRLTLIHGGFGTSDTPNDTFSWDGERLRRVTGPAPALSDVASTQLVALPPAGELGVFRCLNAGLPDGGIGVDGGDLHVYRGDGGWVLLAQRLPCAAHQFLVADPASGGIVWGGGLPVGGVSVAPVATVWSWNLDAGLTAQAPLATPMFGTVGVASSQGPLLFGGVRPNFLAVNDVQRWSSTGVTPVVTTGREPVERDTAATWFDDARGTPFFAFGAQSSFAGPTWSIRSYFNDVATLTPQGEWQRFELADPEFDGQPPTGMAQASWDPVRRRAVLMSPAQGTSSVPIVVRQGQSVDPWEFALAEHRPMAIGLFSAPTSLLRRGELVGASISTLVGGAGFSSDGGVDGVAASVWRDGRWVSLGESAQAGIHSLAFPVPVSAWRELVADLDSFGVRLVPLGRNEAALATLNVDDLELRLTYRLNPR